MFFYAPSQESRAQESEKFMGPPTCAHTLWEITKFCIVIKLPLRKIFAGLAMNADAPSVCRKLTFLLQQIGWMKYIFGTWNFSVLVFSRLWFLIPDELRPWKCTPSDCTLSIGTRIPERPPCFSIHSAHVKTENFSGLRSVMVLPLRSWRSILYKLVRLKSPYYMRPWHVNKTKDTARPQGWRKHVTDVLK